MSAHGEITLTVEVTLSKPISLLIEEKLQLDLKDKDRQSILGPLEQKLKNYLEFFNITSYFYKDNTFIYSVTLSAEKYDNRLIELIEQQVLTYIDLGLQQLKTPTTAEDFLNLLKIDLTKD